MRKQVSFDVFALVSMILQSRAGVCKLTFSIEIIQILFVYCRGFDHRTLLIENIFKKNYKIEWRYEWKYFWYKNMAV